MLGNDLAMMQAQAEKHSPCLGVSRDTSQKKDGKFIGLLGCVVQPSFSGRACTGSET